MSFEANLGKHHTGMPLLIVAISPQMLSWQQYAAQFPAPSIANTGLKGIGHFHPAVQEAAQKVKSFCSLASGIEPGKQRKSKCGLHSHYRNLATDVLIR